MQANPSMPAFGGSSPSQQGPPCLPCLLWEQQTQFPAVSTEAVQAVREMHAVANWERPDSRDTLMTPRDPGLQIPLGQQAHSPRPS